LAAGCWPGKLPKTIRKIIATKYVATRSLDQPGWKNSQKIDGDEGNVIATSRFNRVSRARNTSPIPPAPRAEVIS
jgi:hypothetical protein